MKKLNDFSESNIINSKSLSKLYGGRQVIETKQESYCNGVHMTIEDKIIIHNDGSITTKVTPIQ